MQEQKVSITAGEIVLREPNAGERNDAMINAEVAGGLKMTKFLVELMPAMIKSHPFGAQPVDKALRGLTIKDYDSLIDAAKTLVVVSSEEEAKKFESVSN